MELAQFCMSISIRMLVAIISNPDYNGKRSFHDLWMDPDTRAIVNDYRVSYKSSNKDSAVTLKGDYTESDPLIFTKLKAVEKTVIQD